MTEWSISLEHLEQRLECKETEKRLFQKVKEGLAAKIVLVGSATCYIAQGVSTTWPEFVHLQFIFCIFLSFPSLPLVIPAMTRSHTLDCIHILSSCAMKSHNFLWWCSHIVGHSAL